MDPIPSSAGSAVPPPLGGKAAAAPNAGRQAIAGFLNLCLTVFLIDALVSLLEPLLLVFFGVQHLRYTSGILSIVALLSGLLLYALMGLTPSVPKRLFLPVGLFYPITLLAMIPFAIYWFNRLVLVAWVFSVFQVVLGLVIVRQAKGNFAMRWPLVSPERLGTTFFAWRNLCGFVLANLALVLPATLAYLALCASLAVDHFSDGFLTLHLSGLTVQVREYVRDDGKTIQLVPMAHIGEASFYRQISASIPTNAVILMEGTTDEHDLIANKNNYQRSAKSMGLAAQADEFNPTQARMVMADVDVSEFSTNTITILNLVMLVQAKGINAETLWQLTANALPAGVEKEFFSDVLRKRNRHLLAEIQRWLPRADHLVVPWGVAHIPEIANEIQKSGFRLNKSQDYNVVRFLRGTGESNKRSGRKAGPSQVVLGKLCYARFPNPRLRGSRPRQPIP